MNLVITASAKLAKAAHTLKSLHSLPITSIKQNELNDLIVSLTIYMQEFVSNIKVPCFSEQIKELKNINLLNFNYTYTYKTVYGSPNKSHQVHGSLVNEDIVLVERFRNPCAKYSNNLSSGSISSSAASSMDISSILYVQ